MTLNSKEFVEAIIEHASMHGFPVDTDRQPNFWKITEKGGSFETRFTQMLCWYLDPQSNHGLGIDAAQALLDVSTSAMDSERLILDPSSTKVLAEEYLAYEIEGKFGKLDALVIDENKKILIAIEVKMAAHDHNSQLKKYYEGSSGLRV